MKTNETISWSKIWTAGLLAGSIPLLVFMPLLVIFPEQFLFRAGILLFIAGCIGVAVALLVKKRTAGR